MPQRRNEMTSQVRSEPFAYVAEYDANGNVQYEAWAEPGTSTSSYKWVCCKHTYNVGGSMTKTEWAVSPTIAGHYADYDNKADGLSGLTYA
jgi:hypothetical protein